jgi:ABC-type multidrug transport system fused ATPase/permease subunit
MVLRNGHYLENKVIDWSSVVEVVQRVVHSFGLYILLSPTLPGIYSGMHSPVDIMALLAISVKLQKTSSALAECVRRSQSAAQSDKRRQDLALEKITVVDHTEASELLTCGGRIEFKDVGFSYDNKQILRSVKFSCRSGEVVAFVGPSGAGKSTIFSLIFRHYIPHTGSIYIDGEDIQLLKGISLRRHVGLVTQNPGLFNRSLMENLRLARDGITDEEIYRVAQYLGFHDAFQRVGYEIKVGDRGLSLSGGQRMMVAITMVVIKDAKIILLDEATAAFDPMTENIFQSAIETLKYSKTMIMIA